MRIGLLLFSLFCLTRAVALPSQKNDLLTVNHDIPANIVNSVLNKKTSLSGTNNNRSPVSCGTDTLYYPLFKTNTVDYKILFTNGTYTNSAAQWFPVNSSVPVQLRGFTWYGYSFDPTGVSNPTINVLCEVYNAGSDSLPTGTALASTTVTADSNTVNYEHIVTFSTPVTLSGHYVIVITNPGTDILYYFSNDEGNNEGTSEGLSSSFYEPGNYWRKNIDLWSQGDFDNLFFPHVNYSIDAKFTISASGCVGISEAFTNTSTGYFASRFFSSSIAAGGSASYHWNYGDGNTSSYQKNGSNTYSSPGNYTVTLYDTLYGWTMTCTDLKSTSIDIYSIPAAPSASSPAPVCEGSPIGNLTASGTGGTMKWYTNAAPSGFLGSGNPYFSTISSPTTVYVTETLNGCQSSATAVILNFLTNPIPNVSATPSGGTSINFNTTTTASSYSWNFGDGSSAVTTQSASYTYATSGPFNACLTVTYSNGCSRMKCNTVSFVAVKEAELELIQFYPNPVQEVLLIQVPGTMNDVSYYITDIKGKLAGQGKLIPGTEYINVSGYSGGVYFISFSRINDTGKEIRTGRFVKM